MQSQEFSPSVGEDETSCGKWLRDRLRPSAWRRTRNTPGQRCPESLVTGKSPDSRQDVTSHPLGDTTRPRVCRARWPSVTAVLVSMAVRKSESHVGTSERAGDAHALPPCHSWAHCPRQRKMPGAASVALFAKRRAGPLDGSHRGWIKNRVYFWTCQPLGCRRGRGRQRPWEHQE